MENQLIKDSLHLEKENLLKEFRRASKKIAPVWPLESFVAVNPYLGLTDQKFDHVARDLGAIGGIDMTMPTSFYREKILNGEISREDISAAFYNKYGREADPNEFILDVINEEEERKSAAKVSTLIDVATLTTQKDWNSFMTSRISVWAASYFDNGQAAWKAADQKEGLFTAWKAEAEVDLTPEIAGLKGFRKAVKDLPNDALPAAQYALKLIDVPREALPVYLHRLLLKVGGWSAHAARLDWDNELYGGKDGKLVEFLAVLVCWEACLYEALATKDLVSEWDEAKIHIKTANENEQVDLQLEKNLILQEAFDIASQREIIRKFNRAEAKPGKTETQTKAQAIFCIDVRSEVFRRNLEIVDPEFETIGFAGFFAFPINYIPLAQKTGEAQCPVLIKKGPTVMEELRDRETNRLAHSSRILRNQVKQVWKTFRSGAVSCFSFVSPIGLFYLPKLFTDSFGFTRPVPHPEQAGLKKKYHKDRTVSLKTTTNDGATTGIPLEQRAEMAKNALKAMSLTENFADFVLVVGHGSTTVNNPHATGLDCGACGGRSGEANAKVAAAVLNDLAVRRKLQKENIHIPEKTIFLACLHDTTTDEVSIFNTFDVPYARQKELGELRKSLAQAGYASRTERAARMSVHGEKDTAVLARSKDWSQTRPEWGLAGCSAFVVAPRERTRNLDLGGKSFLHSYDWKKDKGFPVLELIMTAPMVVTSWINLQYYASTVDNKNYGSGNKTLHNVTAGLGVLEGFSGDLRVGLPLQSVHDGEKYQHEPVKLSVIIEAPIEAMNEILQKHCSVKNLFDNHWIYLMAMDESGRVSHRYRGDLEWDEL